MSDNEKIEIFDQWYEKRCCDEDLSPIMDDIYDMISYHYKEWSLIGPQAPDWEKVEYVDKMYPFFKYIVKEGNIELFHDIVNLIIHPNSEKNGTTVIKDLYHLTLDPYDYCRSEKKEECKFTGIADFFVREKNYDFLKKYSNIFYYSCMLKLVEYHEKKDIDWKYGQYIIFYIFNHHIDENRGMKVLDYYLENDKACVSHYLLNWNKNNPNEWLELFMSNLFEEIELNKIEIK